MELFLKVVNARAAACEPLVREKQAMELDVSLDAFAGEFSKRYAHACKCLFACITVGDELTDHTVVIGRNRIARKDVRIDADAGAARQMPSSHFARTRHKGEGVLCIDAAFNGMTADFDIALLEGKTLAGRDADLFGHDINPGDEFCHRMLDLYAGVHFNEVELTVFVEEFERAGTAVADLSGGGFAGPLPRSGCQASQWPGAECRKPGPLQ